MFWTIFNLLIIHLILADQKVMHYNSQCTCPLSNRLNSLRHTHLSFAYGRPVVVLRVITHLKSPFVTG